MSHIDVYDPLTVTFLLFLPVLNHLLPLELFVYLRLIIGILSLCTSAHLTVLPLFNPALNLTFSLLPITSSHPHAFDFWRYINIWLTLIDIDSARQRAHLQTAGGMSWHDSLQHLSPTPASHSSAPSTLLLPQNSVTDSVQPIKQSINWSGRFLVFRLTKQLTSKFTFIDNWSTDQTWMKINRPSM